MKDEAPLGVMPSFVRSSFLPHTIPASPFPWLRGDAHVALSCPCICVCAVTGLESSVAYKVQAFIRIVGALKLYSTSFVGR